VKHLFGKERIYYSKINFLKDFPLPALRVDRRKEGHRGVKGKEGIWGDGGSGRQESGEN